MLSVKEYQTYLYICHYFQRHEQSPTQDEIARGIGIRSRGVVSRYLQALANFDLIKLTKGCHRNISLTKQSHIPCTKLPVVGHFSEGQPLKMLGSEDILDIPHSLLPEKGVVYRVDDVVLLQHNIKPGDYLICDQREAEVGDRVLVGLPLEGMAIGRIDMTGQEDDKLEVYLLTEPQSGFTYPLDSVTLFGVYCGMLRLPVALNSTK